MKKKLLVFIFLGLLFSGCSVYVSRPPKPGPRKEVRPPRPRKRAMWIKGHWKWSKRLKKWVWIPGYWRIK